MNGSGRLGAVLAVLAALVVVVPLAAARPLDGGSRAPSPNGHVVGYFTSWGIYGRSYRVKDVATSGSASRLTVVNYAFANAVREGGDVVCKLGDEWADYQVPWSAEQSVTGQEVTWPRRVLGNFQQLAALKAMHPNVQVLISLGGWSWSDHFSDAALTAQSRERFVRSCVDLFIRGDLPDPGWGGMGGPGAAAGIFDGIDVDWEWPGSDGEPGNVVRPEDRRNFTLLLAEFRAQLDAYGAQAGRHYLLSAFLPAATPKIDAGFEVDRIFASLDFATVQGYDLHGAWEPQTNHQANLRSSGKDPASPRFAVADTVQAYLDRGAPAAELVVGVPFYSRGWTGVAAAGNGLYQSSTGPAPGTWEAGVDDFDVVKARLGAGFKRYTDTRSDASWLFDGTTFWTFDDAKTMREKGEWARKRGLGGIMFWELSGDTPDGELVDAIAAGLGRR